VVRPVLSLMREAAEVAAQERGVVWQQLHAVEAGSALCASHTRLTRSAGRGEGHSAAEAHRL